MADLCTITGTILRPDGTPFKVPSPTQAWPQPEQVAQVTVTIDSTEKDQSGQIAGGVGICNEPVTSHTDENGVFSIDLIQGAVVIFEIQVINLKKKITVPSEPGPVDFSTLI